jgi:hypothetical protein
MKGQWKSSWSAVAVLLAASVTGLAQVNTPVTGTTVNPGVANNYGQTAVPYNGDTRQNRMASPGTVNYIEGDVTLNGDPLPARSAGSAVIGPNQVIATGNGYAEVLLSPGAFLRLGHNSEVQMISAGLANIQLQVNRGSAMVESADPVKGSTLEVTVNGAATRIDRGGLYAFDANSQCVKVLDGKAEVRQGAGETTLKKGDEVLLASENPLKKRDFSVKSAEEDSLYVWSKVRSREESEANVHAANLIVAGGGWYGPGWYWDPFWSGYAFLPGVGIWNSPFGWGFYSPRYVYAAPLIYGRGYYGVRGYYGLRPGYIGGVRTQVRPFAGAGFHGGRR